MPYPIENVCKITTHKFIKSYIETREPLQSWKALLNVQVAYSNGDDSTSAEGTIGEIKNQGQIRWRAIILFINDLQNWIFVIEGFDALAAHTNSSLL